MSEVDDATGDEVSELGIIPGSAFFLEAAQLISQKQQQGGGLLGVGLMTHDLAHEFDFIWPVIGGQTRTSRDLGRCFHNGDAIRLTEPVRAGCLWQRVYQIHILTFWQASIFPGRAPYRISP